MFENDESILKEVEVVLSKQFLNLLYILQFPIRPSTLTYNNATFLEARVKPKQQIFDIQIALNSNSENYDINSGKQWALEFDAKDSIVPSQYNKTDKIDKQIFTSTCCNIDCNKYSIACYQNCVLYLFSVDAFLQLRPNIKYIDKIEAHKNKNKKIDLVSETFLKPLVPRYAPKENEEDKAKRLASFDFYCNIQDDEQWISINERLIFKMKDISTELFGQTNMFNKLSELNMPKLEFMNQLLPNFASETNLSPTLPSNIVSMSDLKFKPVADQIRILLECAKVMRFEKLISFISKDIDYDIECLLRCVQQVGILVQGCWVYKSELLYNGENSETLCRVRDFILWSFTQNKSITRKDLRFIAKLPTDEEKELLSKIAKRQIYSRDWEFIMNEDTQFIIQNPDIVQRQSRIWEKRHLQITAFINAKNCVK